MSARQLANRAQVISTLVSALTLAGSVASSKPVLIALTGAALFGCAAWVAIGLRRERESPLTVDLEGASTRHEHFGLNSCRRIRVRNSRGPATVKNVRVQLEECIQQNATFYPVLLQRMHADEPHPFDLDPEAAVFVDLVYLPTGSTEYGLAYDPRKLPPRTPNAVKVQPLDLVVSVTATDTAMRLHDFAVSVDGSKNVHVVQMSPPQGRPVPPPGSRDQSKIARLNA
jgi:hypothetical protein